MIALRIIWTLIIAVFCTTANPLSREENTEQPSDVDPNLVRQHGTKGNQNLRLFDSMDKTNRRIDLEALHKSSKILENPIKKLNENDDTEMNIKRKTDPVKKILAHVQEMQGDSSLTVQSETSPQYDERVGKDAKLHHNGQAKNQNQIKMNGDQVNMKQNLSQLNDVKISNGSTEKFSSTLNKELNSKRTDSISSGGRSISRPHKQDHTRDDKDVNSPSYGFTKLKKLVNDANNEEQVKKHLGGSGQSNLADDEPPAMSREKQVSFQKEGLPVLDNSSKDASSQLANEKNYKMMRTYFNGPPLFRDDDNDVIFHFPRGTFCNNSISFIDYLKMENIFTHMKKATRKKIYNKDGCGCYGCGCDKDCVNTTVVDAIYDCSNKNLTTIPSLSALPENIIGLDLMMNYIEDISDISKFSSLRFLRLCCNNISTLDKNTFSGLSKLEYLSLAENNIAMSPKNFPNGFFSKLTNLVYLELQGNNKMLNDSTLRYPGGALVGLSKLKTLHMDGLTNQTFGVEFKNLTSLMNVHLPGFSSGYCILHTLSNTTFLNLPSSVEKLNISNCNIHGSMMSSDTLKPLKNLNVLDISYNPNIGVKRFFETMCAIKKYNISVLLASAFVTRYSNGINISKTNVSCLPINLKHLTAVSNSIESFDKDVFDKLPKNLTTLDLSDNKLTFGNYLKNISKMKNLKELRVEGSSYVYRIPTHYPREYSDQLIYNLEHETPPPANTAEISQDDTGESSYAIDEERSYSFNIIPQDVDHNAHDFDRGGPKINRAAFVLHLPPNLKYISLQKYGLRYILSSLTVNINNTLEILNMNYNYFPEIWGDFEGLTSLKSLSLVQCATYFINEKLFKSLDALENLDLSLNFLGTTKYFIQGLFENASNLKYLNLKNNEIKNLTNNTFKGLSNLRVLNLQNNPFWEFPVDLNCTEKLHSLKLSFTSLHTLDETTQQMIDDMNITVNMEHTPIYCNCQNLQFLRWITEATSVQRSNKYLCSYQTKKDELVTDMYQHITSVLEGECVQHLNEFYWVMSGCVLMLIAVLGSIIYRFRWKIRYFYYGAYLRFIEANKDRNTDRFGYDIFLSYAFEDTEFVQGHLDPALTSRGLKVLVHGRDFVAGEYIASNIVTAVMRSRKTLVVLTENLLKSDWCNYELQMANLESVNTGRPVLIFLLKDRLPKSRLGRQLLYHINNNTYKPYPPEELTHDEAKMNLFWDSLVHDIRQ